MTPKRTGDTFASMSRRSPAAAIETERTARVRCAILAAAALACLLGGCGTAATVNKEGAKIAAGTITLRMETPDAPQADADYFVEQVLARTHGQLHIVVADDYPSADPNNELRLAEALREGSAEMAYIPSRAWERDGGRVLAFRALQAPFLIDSYPLLRAVTTGSIAQQLLASLGPDGLVGLGLVPTELRRVLGRRPLVSPADLRGARIRVPTSPTSVVDRRALGAIPLTDFTSTQVGPALADGRLDGIETSTLDIVNNGYLPDARYLSSNFALFAKTETIAITKATFARLSPADRAALKAAAAATAAHADPAAEELTALKQLCTAGVRLVRATPSQLASLERAAAPVYTALERDPATNRAILEIERLKQQLPTDNTSLPACPPAHPTTASVAAKPFPTGTFETVLTRAEVIKAGFPASNAASQTLTFRKNGTWWNVVFDPTTPQNPPGGGRYTVRGDILTLGPPAGPDVLKWSYFRGELTFQIVSVPDPFAQFGYTAHPWRKIR